MKNFYLLLFLLSYALGISQTTKYQGQPPIVLVPTISKPTQKQWKGDFTFNDGAITFSNDFEGGRLNGIQQNDDGTYTALITSENTPVNISPWYAFKVQSKRHDSITITMTYQESVKHRYYPKLSKDGLNWTPLDSIDYKEFEKGTAAFGGGSLPVKVSMKVAVGPQGTLWIAGQELQTSSHVKKWSQKLAVNKYVKHSSIGKSKEGRTMQALTIGKADSKRMLMVISRQHPPEVTGYLAMKSFVETIAGDSKLAKKFRKKFTTYVVPLMNPDGVDNGHWRHNAGGIDLNRDWANLNQPETTAVSEFMKEREKATNGKFYFGIDFHSTWDDIYYTLDPKHKGNMPGLVPKWLDGVKEAFEGYDPNIRPSDRLEPTAVSRNYFFVKHGAEALVFEIGDNTPREFIKEKGEVSANTLMRLMLEELTSKK